ncbi:hypothetical protein TTRE_0000407801 [Trichuris trichiura]|uniref:PDZ domain-containing protein n=1 Tax=Trichuris trichiura TaxID=36087 RepID=A0A077ZAV9_TRITR|nr:hypothetical protein TTRE_0000407801 [Trichuris trichiura]
MSEKPEDNSSSGKTSGDASRSSTLEPENKGNVDSSKTEGKHPHSKVVDKVSPGPVGGIKLTGQPATVVALDEGYGWDRSLRIGDKILGIERKRPQDAQHCQILMNQYPTFKLVIERPIAKLEAAPMEPECDIADLELIGDSGSPPKKEPKIKPQEPKVEEDEEGAQFSMLPPDVQMILRRKRNNFQVDMKKIRERGEFRHFSRKNVASATILDKVQKVAIRNDIPRWKHLRAPPKM